MLAPVDVAIIGAFLVYAVLAGWRSRAAASRSLDEYFLAGRTLPGWKAGISMAATQFAADTPLLVTGLIATAGLFSLWRLWIYAFAFLLMGFVLAAPWRRAGVLTDAELAELRYGGRPALALRVAKALYLGTAFNCTVLAMVLLAATRVAEPFLTWQTWLPAWAFDPLVTLVRAAGLTLTVGEHGDPAVRSASNLCSLGAVVGVTALYSATGGLRAVVATDLVQFAIAMVATLVYAVILVQAAGGLAALPDALAARVGPDAARGLLAFTPDLAPDAGLAVLGVIAIQWLAQMNADGTGYLAQRTMACRSDADARTAAIVFAVAQIVLRSLLWIPIGIALLCLVPLDPGAPAAAREATYVDGIARWMPAGARGLLLTGMLAALASTVDTHLNWGASYWANDLYGRVWCQAWRGRTPSPRTLVWVARASTLGILGLAGVILLHLDSIQTAWTASLLLGAGLGVPLVLRWCWWRVTAAAELAALGTAAGLAPLLLHLVDTEAVRLLAMASGTALVTVLVARFGPADSAAAADAFYRRVRPPGFWGPVARRCGDDPVLPRRALGAGLLATFTGGFALFCVLVGIGTWLVGSPPPAWAPSRAAWIAGTLLAGVAATVIATRAAAYAVVPHPGHDAAAPAPRGPYSTKAPLGDPALPL